MLKPAILYKDELDYLFKQEAYTDDYFLYAGYCGCNEPPSIDLKDDRYQYAIINCSGDDVIGYLAYQIDMKTDTVFNFGLYSFDHGNPTVGKDVFDKLTELISEHRRIEWRMIGGNPVQRSYDSFCKKFNGNVVILHDVTRDHHGKYHDEYIYEILKEEKK